MEPWQYLKAYVKANDQDDAFLMECWEKGQAAVDKFIGSAAVPDHIYTGWVKEAGSNYYRRRAQQVGVGGFSQDTTTTYVANDPLQSLYPDMKRYVGWF